jgi:predicted ATP-grasp superfamily ATP-dependent carboligase
VLREEGHFLGAASRYASRSLRWPVGDGFRQLDFLANLAVREGLKGWALFPTTDELVMLVARHHKSLAAHFRLTIPSWDALQWVCDKRLLHRLAQDLGINQPCSFFPRNRDEIASLECRFPVILKPALRLGFNRFTKDKAWPVANRASLLARYEEACELIGPDMIMVQEVVQRCSKTVDPLHRSWLGAYGSFRWITVDSAPTLKPWTSRKWLKPPFDCSPRLILPA